MKFKEGESEDPLEDLHSWVDPKDSSWPRFQQQFFDKCMAITAKKNHDYTNNDTDSFANFRAVETLGIDPEVGFLTRMMDKMMRLSTFVHQGKLEVQDEKVEDTLNDLANYCSLFAGYLHFKSRR